MFSINFVLALPALASALPAAAADPAPAAATIYPEPSEVYLNAIAYGGTGCPQGSIGSFISDDRQTFVLQPVVPIFLFKLISQPSGSP